MFLLYICRKFLNINKNSYKRIIVGIIDNYKLN